MVPSIDTTVLEGDRGPGPMRGVHTDTHVLMSSRGDQGSDNERHNRRQQRREYEWGRDIRQRVVSTGGRNRKLGEDVPRDIQGERILHVPSPRGGIRNQDEGDAVLP